MFLRLAELISLLRFLRGARVISALRDLRKLRVAVVSAFRDFKSDLNFFSFFGVLEKFSFASRESSIVSCSLASYPDISTFQSSKPCSEERALKNMFPLR